MYILAFI